MKRRVHIMRTDIKRRTKKNKRTNNRRFVNLLLLVLTLVALCGTITAQAAEESKKVVKVTITFTDIADNSDDATKEQAKTSSKEEISKVEESSTEEALEEDTEEYIDSQSSISSLSEEELYFFAECIEMEAGNQGIEGKIAVANVLMNRVYSDKFPNTYKGVVSQKCNGTYQFSSYAKGWGSKSISQETYDAIEQALNGENNVGESTYFVNLNACNGSWFTNNLTKVVKIGSHTFFKA
jgi:N-acetylmuramoyl-L-alanine amidase